MAEYLLEDMDFDWTDSDDSFVTLQDTDVLSGSGLLSAFPSNGTQVEASSKATAAPVGSPSASTSSRKPRKLEIRTLQEEAAQLEALVQVLEQRASRSEQEAFTDKVHIIQTNERGWKSSAEKELGLREQAVAENLQLRKQLRGNAQLAQRMQKQMRLLMAHSTRELLQLDQEALPLSPTSSTLTQDSSMLPALAMFQHQLAPTIHEMEDQVMLAADSSVDFVDSRGFAQAVWV